MLLMYDENSVPATKKDTKNEMNASREGCVSFYVPDMES